MKKVFLYLILCFTSNSFAQTYFPFPDSVAIWRQTSTTGDAIVNPPLIFNQYALFINGDTNIDNNTYNKLYYSDNPSNIDTTNSRYYGGLREFNKKIYFYPDSNYNNTYNYNFCYNQVTPNPPNFHEELLLYDFDVSIGDTVFYPHIMNSFMIINSIDSVLVQGQYRKRYNYLQPFCGTFGRNYVEGIGDITSGLFAHWTFYLDNTESLRCFEDEQVFYSNVQNCLITGVKELINENDLKIYPNPASGYLFLEFTDFDNSTVYEASLFDITGKRMSSQLINQQLNSIDISTLKKGVYIVQLKNNKEILAARLISIK